MLKTLFAAVFFLLFSSSLTQTSPPFNPFNPFFPAPGIASVSNGLSTNSDGSSSFSVSFLTGRDLNQVVVAFVAPALTSVASATPGVIVSYDGTTVTANVTTPVPSQSSFSFVLSIVATPPFTLPSVLVFSTFSTQIPFDTRTFNFSSPTPTPTTTSTSTSTPITTPTTTTAPTSSSSNVSFTTSNVSISTSNVSFTASNVSIPTSNVSFTTSTPSSAATATAPPPSSAAPSSASPIIITTTTTSAPGAAVAISAVNQAVQSYGSTYNYTLTFVPLVALDGFTLNFEFPSVVQPTSVVSNAPWFSSSGNVVVFNVPLSLPASVPYSISINVTCPTFQLPTTLEFVSIVSGVAVPQTFTFNTGSSVLTSPPSQGYVPLGFAAYGQSWAPATFVYTQLTYSLTVRTSTDTVDYWTVTLPAGSVSAAQGVGQVKATLDGAGIHLTYPSSTAPNTALTVQAQFTLPDISQFSLPSSVAMIFSVKGQQYNSTLNF